MRTAFDILLTKPAMFNVIDPDAKIIDALQMMNAVNHSYLVVKKNHEFLGVFSERDYSRNVILKGLHSETATVRQAMNVSLPSVELTESVESCMNLLNSQKARYLLVFEKKHLKGVITINDLLKEVIANKETVFNDRTAVVVNEMADIRYKIF